MVALLQQLGNIRQLEGVCAPFGRGVGECAFSRIYICIGYTLPTFGENVSVWRVSVRPSGAGLENVHFLEYSFVLDIHCHFLEYTFVSDIHIANNWGKCVSWRVSVRHLAAEFGNVHFLESVLDIHCHWNVGHLESVCYSHRAIALSQRTVLKAAFRGF